MHDDDPPAPAPARDTRVGMLLDQRYRIVKKLGEGGMGAVYEAQHVLLDKRVALKTLHAHFATNAQVVARFHREARAASAVGNEHIVEVTDFGAFPDGAAYMVLEHLEGTELADLVEKEGALPLGRAQHILEQICDALTAAHAKGIVHRDLKPENVFLIRRGEDPDFVKVLDFGISKMHEAAGGPGKLTSTGDALGTPYYMSPEQARGSKNVDARADIYALGVVLFNLLTARHPFEAESLPMLVVQICTEPPPPIRSLRTDLPAELEAVVAKMLAKDPAERFADCRSVKLALAPFRDVRVAPVLVERPPAATDPFARTAPSHAGAIPVQTPAPATTAGRASRARTLQIGGLVVGLLAVSIGLAIGLGDRRSQGPGSTPTVTPTLARTVTPRIVQDAQPATAPVTPTTEAPVRVEPAAVTTPGPTKRSRRTRADAGGAEPAVVVETPSPRVPTQHDAGPARTAVVSPRTSVIADPLAPVRPRSDVFRRDAGGR